MDLTARNKGLIAQSKEVISLYLFFTHFIAFDHCLEDFRTSGNAVQIKRFFNFPSIPVGNKAEWKGLKFLTPL